MIEKPAGPGSGQGEGEEGLKRCRDHVKETEDQGASELKAINELLKEEIEERRWAEESLKESEEKYRALIETTDTGFVILKRDGTVVDGNAEFVRLTGNRTLEEIQGRNVIEWTAPHDAARNAQAVASCFERGFIRNLEIDYMDSRGSIVPVEVNATVIGTGDEERIVSLCRDITGRRQTEEALKESERRYRELADSLPQIVAEFDTKGNFTFVNRNAFAAFGYTPEDLEKGFNVLQTVMPHDQQRARESLARAARGETLMGNEYDLRRKDGSSFPAIAYTNPVSRHGKVVGHRSILIDITDRKRGEEALRLTEARYRTLLEHIRDGVFILDTEGRFTYVNDVLLERSGHPREWFMGRKFSAVVGKRSKALARKNFRSDIRGNIAPPYEIALAYPNASGHEFWIEVNRRALYEGDRIVGILGTSRDITKRKYAEAALKESEERYRSIFESSPLGIFQSTCDGKFIRVNPALARLLGYGSPREVIESVHDIAARIYVEPKQGTAILRKMMESDGQIMSENEYRRKDGRKWIGHLTLSAVRDVNGIPHHLDGIVEDVTAKRAMEERLQSTMGYMRTLSHRLLEIQEAERRYVARELHDEMGQTLTALKISLKRAERSMAPGSKTTLHESVQMVEGLMRQVRNLSIELRPSILDDFGLTAALEWYINRLSAKTGLKILFQSGLKEERFSPLLELTCFRITQEALTNVVRHSKAKNVRVELERREGNLHLTVRDDGSGFNVDKTSRRSQKGESFGLLGMHERASLAGGNLELRSEPGRGTVVHATFSLGPATEE